jgi:hypothetical protein
MTAPGVSTSRIRLLLLVISGATILSGASQAVAPGLVLRVLSVDRTVVTRQLFATIGLFMVAFGGMLLHALLVGDGDGILVLWAGVQKFLASVAVIVGVARDVFGAVALLVAAFDLFSGIVCLVYRRRTAGSMAPLTGVGVAAPGASG